MIRLESYFLHVFLSHWDLIITLLGIQEAKNFMSCHSIYHMVYMW